LLVPEALFASQLVVQMSNDDPADLEFRAQLQQSQQQSHTVRPSGNSCHQAIKRGLQPAKKLVHGPYQ
jgi:hypothetical protein